MFSSHSPFHLALFIVFRTSDKSFAAYTEQNDLIKAMNKSEDPELIQQMKKELRNKAREILGKLFEENGVNLLVAPCDSGFCVYAAAAGTCQISGKPSSSQGLYLTANSLANIPRLPSCGRSGWPITLQRSAIWCLHHCRGQQGRPSFAVYGGI